MYLNKNILLIILVLLVGLAGVGGWLFWSGKLVAPGLQTVQTASPTPSVEPVVVEETLAPVESVPPIASSKIPTVLFNSVLTGMDITVADTMINFTKDTAVINITSTLSEDTPDAAALIEVTYTPTGDKIGPISAPVKSLGKQKYVSAKISKPTNGWLPGNYLVKVVLPSGGEQQAGFEVE